MPKPHTYTYITKQQIGNPKGINDGFWITHVSYGKDSVYSTDSVSPYLYPNEWIAGNLALFLRLPIPPFAKMCQLKNDPITFASLSFAPSQITSESTPDDADPFLLWESVPSLCTGILLFDILIGNVDRASRNLSVDDPAKQSKVFIYDHDSSVCGRMYGDAAKHMNKYKEAFLVDDHCLLLPMNTDQHFTEWFRRIDHLPPFFVHEICQEAITKGFTKKDAKAAEDFILHRAKKLRKIVGDHKNCFPNIKRWGNLL